jgi:hypothetical protein
MRLHALAEVGPSSPMRYESQADRYLMQPYDCSVVLHEATFYDDPPKSLIVFADGLLKAAEPIC